MRHTGAALLGGGLVALACAALGAWLLLRAPAGPRANAPPAPALQGAPAPVDVATAPPPPPTMPAPPMPSGGAPVRERVIRGTASVGAEGDQGSEGELDARGVASRIRARVGAIRGCYERALRDHPTLAGRIEVRFTIGPEGRVNSIRPEGLPEAPEVGACVANVIRRVEFPRPTGGAVEFSFPFTFSPGG